MITKIEKFLNKLDALKAAERSPNLEEMQGPFKLNDKTVIYFPKRMSDDKIKSRIKAHLLLLDKLDMKSYVPMDLKVVRGIPNTEE